MKEPSKRNKLKTKEDFKDAVSRMLRTKGFPYIKNNKIAKEIEKDKRLLSHHFDGVNGLVKDFIKDKDYWSKLFENFNQPNLGSLELKDLFISMMQENFEIFGRDEEMQSIIRWQISEENKVLKEISDQREEAGAKLMALTDPIFKGTGINFQCLMAIILGGSYYIILHSDKNKSVVCGVDIKREEDRNDFIRTIGQILDWAWSAAKS
ncbi:TetR/AcrR family transcriptional regulator [Pedobacter aquatilis]|uniref:TetR/AcrR family transcriptional regulator n=1 Tax=Pedobacter aquatilis TaxID=351343 RepID=UPI00292E6A74|nr:TetR/AcrR family transcriptional regulator [Pedobacter aquatilis]